MYISARIDIAMYLTFNKYAATGINTSSVTADFNRAAGLHAVYVTIDSYGTGRFDVLYITLDTNIDDLAFHEFAINSLAVDYHMVTIDGYTS